MENLPLLECIMLVDDDDSTNFLNKIILKKVVPQVHVQAEQTVQHALDYLKNAENKPLPGIIFLDINMPGLSGWDFMEEYEKLPAEKKAQMVIVMLSTSLNPDDREKAKSFNEIHDFFNKPLTEDMIRDLLKHFRLS